MNQRIRIALIQMQCHRGPAGNLEHALTQIELAAEQGAQIVCLPELFLSPYFCQSEDHCHFGLAESIPGPTTERLAPIAKKHRVVIVASLFERRTAGLYHNTAAIVGVDGQLMGIYRKMHIPDDPRYYEKFYFTPGDLGFRVFPTPYLNLGTLICWDQWFPEAARMTAMLGAELIVYPTAIGWHPSEKSEFGEAQHNSWETIQRSHAIANGCYVASINRIGNEYESPASQQAGEDPIEFWGQSFACDPSGTIVAKASVDKEEILIVDIDRERLDVTRTHWPFFRDRRVDAYDGITKRFLDRQL